MKNSTKTTVSNKTGKRLTDLAKFFDIQLREMLGTELERIKAGQAQMNINKDRNIASF